jgi:hypothetical protein
VSRESERESPPLAAMLMLVMAKCLSRTNTTGGIKKRNIAEQWSQSVDAEWMQSGCRVGAGDRRGYSAFLFNWKTNSSAIINDQLKGQQRKLLFNSKVNCIISSSAADTSHQFHHAVS